MAVYLISREPKGRTLVHSQTEHAAGLAICSEENSAGVVLCTKEYADEQFLMHYRKGGEKNGVRRWQNKDGSYTPEGYKHYAEMYGWGKFRADRAEKKAAKYEDKAKKAEAELHKQQVKADKAQVKVDRKGSEKNIQKSQAATNKLHEAQLRFDQYRNKAEKYQSKTDRLHDKWDEQTKKLEEKADKALEKGDTEKAAAYEKELRRRGITLDKPDPEKPELSREQEKPSGKDFAGDKATANIPTSASNDGDPHHKDASEWTDEDRSKAVQDKTEKDDFVRSAKGKLESGEDKDRAQVLESLFKMHHEGQKNIDDPYYQEDWLHGAGDFKEDIGFRNHQIEGILWEEIDRVSGNENVGEYMPGSNGAKAHDALMSSYDKSWERRLQLEKENDLDPRNTQKSERVRTRDYEKLKNILASDRIYQALAANDKKNEDALLSAILKDLGVSDSPENRSLIFPIVFRD